MFTDIEGSTRLLERFGPQYETLLADHRAHQLKDLSGPVRLYQVMAAGLADESLRCARWNNTQPTFPVR